MNTSNASPMYFSSKFMDKMRINMKQDSIKSLNTNK